LTKGIRATGDQDTGKAPDVHMIGASRKASEHSGFGGIARQIGQRRSSESCRAAHGELEKRGGRG
jgi:hypothetical protein